MIVVFEDFPGVCTLADPDLVSYRLMEQFQDINVSEIEQRKDVVVPDRIWGGDIGFRFCEGHGPHEVTLGESRHPRPE